MQAGWLYLSAATSPAGAEAIGGQASDPPRAGDRSASAQPRFEWDMALPRDTRQRDKNASYTVK